MSKLNLVLSLLLFSWFISVTKCQTLFDITKLGAMPNGDATPGLVAAWKAACASPIDSKIIVPPGEYRLGVMNFIGPCKAKIKIEINGNFMAPADAKVFNGADTWVRFERVADLTVTATRGAGIFDGQGQQTWKNNNCLENPKCHNLPYNFRFNFLTNSEISGLTSLNSKLFHIAVLGCEHLNLHDFTITAPADSPNTDGIHIGRSNGVNITRFNIGTGDDCVSFGDGAQNVLVEKVTCGPGHGISVGSLGRYHDERPVSGITVRNCTMKNTDNGVRVKTWGGSDFKLLVSALHFEDIIVDNVRYPIVVDQEYCPYNKCNAKKGSQVKLSDIRFKNVRGVATESDAVKVICSSALCDRVELTDIDLTFKGRGGPMVFMCKNVKPITGGTQNPPPCDAKPTSTANDV